jgi:hypothetical protein
MTIIANSDFTDNTTFYQVKKLHLVVLSGAAIAFFNSSTK